MKDRRHVAQFYSIQRHENRDILLSPIPGICKLTVHSGYISGIGDNFLSHPAQIK